MYWEKPGEQNTKNTIEMALQHAKKNDIEDIVIASSTGKTAIKLLNLNENEELNICCITSHCGFKEPGYIEMEEENREKLISAGIKVYSGTHLLAGVDRSIRFKYGGLYPPELIANTLRMFGEGVKVCVEISIMALDAGLVSFEKDLIAIGGTNRGADTAVEILPGHSNCFFKTKINEIICRPDYRDY